MIKKALFGMLILLSASHLSAQTEKGKMMINAFGNYSKTTSENGVTTNQFSTRTKSLNAGTSVGYFFADQFIAGVGLEYVHGKEDRFNSVFINNFIQAEEMNIKSSGLLPHAYLGYYLPVVPKLYFNSCIKISYGQLKSDYKTSYYGRELSTDGSILLPGTGSPYSRGAESNMKSDYFETLITPELSYLFARKFSVYLGCGGISYSMYDWKTDNSSWLISFNPNYWKLGIKIHL